MIDFLNIWVKAIIFTVMFAVFVELLLPNSQMQKFVRVVLGLFIMLAILNPFIDFLDGSKEISYIPVSSYDVSNTDLDRQVQNASEQTIRKREEMSYGHYQRDLEKQFRSTVMSIEGVKDSKVTVLLSNNTKENSSLDKDTRKRIPRIKEVVIEIEIMQPEKSGSINVDKVSVLEKNLEQKEISAAANNEVRDNKIKDRVKNTVSQLYNIRLDQIEVSVVKNLKEKERNMS
ncbi:stage III sporulation protein AF [Selenomonadales bacterium OttesenSCG-928-I06]|nr:stage III sporulation protein AF [Selenomonadales bacterium OttesenSCG-928-I06]